MPTYDELRSAALALPRPARWHLLKALFVSLEADPETDPAWLDDLRTRIVQAQWNEEADERFRAFAAGELDAIAAKEALVDLREPGPA